MSFFRLAENQTSFKKEAIAALTTFVTMAYIVIIAPQMLHDAGIPYASAFVACCLVIIVGSVLNAFLSNFPIALGPGLGLLSYFAYVVVDQLHFSWQAGLAAVLISGLIFLVITLTKLRQYILEAIPHSLGCAIAAGIGFFIGFIALRDVGLVVGNPDTLLALGSVHTQQMALFFVGFFIIAILDQHKVPGAILIGIVAVTAIGWVLGLNHIDHIVALPHYSGETWWAFDFHGLAHKGSAAVIFTFVIIALFDSTGTLLGLVKQFPDQVQQQTGRVNRALLAESLATCFAATVGSSTTSLMVENASGIYAGGRTGLTAFFVACCFLVILFLSPLAQSIPSFATSAALIYVACLMVKPFAGVAWEQPGEYIPAVITLLMIPLSFSIADGVGLGVICYVVLNVATNQWRKIHPILWVLFVVFIVYFLL